MLHVPTPPLKTAIFIILFSHGFSCCTSINFDENMMVLSYQAV
ncbi:hypothetical protein B4143_3216 [Bacillus subtilis]|nr:hypothetical protein B4146_4429 [Bacillus subtilis]KIO57210.1 hypothetical protein B4143_3216 [Bacillus subtilis]RAP07498.1 hypothetical protein HS3_01417 [Bacillus subtilis]